MCVLSRGVGAESPSHSLVDHVELHGVSHNGSVSKGVLTVHTHLAILEDKEGEGLVEPHAATVPMQQVRCPRREVLERKGVSIQVDLK